MKGANEMGQRVIKILAICGNGLGSSLLVKMALESVLEELNVHGIVESTSVAEAAGLIPFNDLIITTPVFFRSIEVPPDKPVALLTNLLDRKALTEKVKEVITTYFPEQK